MKSGTGTNNATKVPNARVLAGGGKLKETTSSAGYISTGITGLVQTIAPKVELYAADEVAEPKNKVY
jgi:hypothetical protein